MGIGSAEVHYHPISGRLLGVSGDEIDQRGKDPLWYGVGQEKALIFSVGF